MLAASVKLGRLPFLVSAGRVTSATRRSACEDGDSQLLLQPQVVAVVPNLCDAAAGSGAAAGVLLLAAVGFAGVEVHEGVCAHEPTGSDCSGAEGSLDPGAFSLLASLNFEFLVLAAIPYAIFLAATAIVVSRTTLLPRWLGISAAVLAVLFPIATIVKFAVLILYFPFLAWIVAASVILARRA